MKNFGTMVRNGCLVLLVGALAGAALLTLAYLLPVRPANRDSTYRILEEEGRYTRAMVSGELYGNHYDSFLLPDGLDNATDSVMLTTALDESNGSPLARAMRAYSATEGEQYTYYWHGYVALLRPLLLLLDYEELRVVNCAVQILLVAVLLSLIVRKQGGRYGLMLLTSYFLLMPVALPLSLQFSWIFYVAYAGTALLLWKREFFARRSRAVLFFLAMGMASCYFDLLTYPLFTWGFPLVWWIVLDPEQKREREWVREVVVSGIGWIAGYAGMWLMKWTLATLVLKENVFVRAVNEIFLRSGMKGDGTLEERLQAIYINWKHYQYKVYAWILAGWLLYLVCRLLYQGMMRRDPKRYAYLLIGFSSVVWYFVLSNHTRGHNYFTYRVFGVSVLAFLALTLGSVVPMERTKEARRTTHVPFQSRLAIAGALLVFAAASVPLAGMAREKLDVINGGELFQSFPMEEGETLAAVFSPSLDEIRGFCIGLECDGTEGSCELTLWDGDKPVYEEELPLAGFGESNFQRMDVDWKLNHRKEYLLTVKVQDAEQPVYVWVTQNGAMPLVEYGDLSLDGAPLSGQLLTGISYWGEPVSAGARLFLRLTWFGILISIAIVLIPEKIIDKFRKQ